MTRDEYKALISKIKTDNTDALLELQEAIFNDCTVIETITLDNKNKDDKINELRDINSKLFIRCTAPIDDNKEQPDSSVDDIIKEMTGNVH